MVSYGATCSKTNRKLSKNYVAENPNCTEHNHISPERKVDASTCLFPDFTWFIRDSWHDNYGDFSYWLGRNIFNADRQLTVYDFDDMPQYVQQGDGADNYVVITDETVSRNPNDSNKLSPVMKLVKFFDKLIQLIKQLLNKDA